MNPSSGTACIAYGLAILFVLLSPVTGQGFAFDSSSCSLEAMSYLRDKFQRAARISENSGNVLDFPGPRGDYTWIAQSLMDPLRHILGGVTPAIAVEVLRGVFTKWSNPDLWLDTRVGIASYWNYLGVFDSRATPRPSRVDRQGNLVIFQALLCMQHLPLFDTLTCLKLVYCNGNPPSLIRLKPFIRLHMMNFKTLFWKHCS